MALLNAYSPTGVNAGTAKQSFNQAVNIAAGIANAEKANAGLSVNNANSALPLYLGGGSSGGGGGTGGSTATKVDPYAKYGGQAAYNNLMGGFDTQRSAIFDTTRDAAANEGITYKNSILDYVDSLRNAQNSVNNKGVNNELFKSQSTANVNADVGKGLRNGATMLQNRNAGSSSAAGQIAKAYSDLGRRELTKVNNKYEMTNRDIGLEQEQVDNQRNSGARKLGDSKNQVVNSLVGQARDKIASLQAAMANADLPTRFALNDEVNNVRGQILAQLSQYDSLLGGADGVRATSTAERAAEANRLGNLGTVAEGALDFSLEAPQEFNNTGPYASELPLFTTNRRRTA